MLLKTLALVLGVAASAPPPQKKVRQKRKPGPTIRLRLELAMMVGFDERQVEGDGRDDKVSQDVDLYFNFVVAYDIWKGIHAGLLLNFDYRVVRTDAPGPSSSWEVNFGILVRYAFLRYLFVQVAYLPLMVRHDPTRTDLPDVDGNTSAPFFGSHAIAWLFGAGAQVPFLNDRLHVLFKLEYRIRYFVRRRGKLIANDQMFGGQSFYPYLGVSWTF